MGTCLELLEACVSEWTGRSLGREGSAVQDVVKIPFANCRQAGRQACKKTSGVRDWKMETKGWKVESGTPLDHEFSNAAQILVWCCGRDKRCFVFLVLQNGHPGLSHRGRWTGLMRMGVLSNRIESPGAGLHVDGQTDASSSESGTEQNGLYISEPTIHFHRYPPRGTSQRRLQVKAPLAQRLMEF